VLVTKPLPVTLTLSANGWKFARRVLGPLMVTVVSGAVPLQSDAQPPKRKPPAFTAATVTTVPSWKTAWQVSPQSM
jgi:hypothetical protein